MTSTRSAGMSFRSLARDEGGAAVHLKPATFSISKDDLKHEYVIRHQYDPQNHLFNLMSYKGTALYFVFGSKTFWLLCLYNTFVCVGWMFLDLDTRQHLRVNWSLRSGYISALSSLVVFTIVFYTGNCYVVYKELFHMGCRVSRRIVTLAMHLKSVFRNEEDVWACIRHMIAAQRIFYYELKAQMAEYHGEGPGGDGHPGKWEDWAMERLVKKNLIKPKEASVLTKYEGKKITLLSGWAQTSFIQHSKQNAAYLSLAPPLQSQFLRVAMAENENLQELLTSTRETKEFGVPFVYHHIVHLLVLFYLLLLSFANLFIDETISYWALITYPVQCFVMQGILAAADAMADPFGEDDCDFNIEALMIICYNDVAHLVDFINTDEAIMDSIAVGHCAKPKIEHTGTKITSGVDVFAGMTSHAPSEADSPTNARPVRTEPASAPLQSPLLFSKPPPPEPAKLVKPGEVNPEEGGSATMRMMQLMMDSVKTLAEKNQEQAKHLLGVEQRMAEMFGEVKAELEAATRRHRREHRSSRRSRAESGSSEHRSPASSRASGRRRGGDEWGSAALVKRRDKEGVEMTARARRGRGGEGSARQLEEVALAVGDDDDDEGIVAGPF